jgi:hypothetical protein
LGGLAGRDGEGAEAAGGGDGCDRVEEGPVRDAPAREETVDCLPYGLEDGLSQRQARRNGFRLSSS